MRDAERYTLHPNLLRNLCSLACYRQRRTPARLSHHFQIHPLHPAPPARPQRLHRRFFRRKPPRIPLILVLEPLAVLALPRRIDPPKKHFPMALDRPLDAFHFRNVHAHPNNQDASSAPTLGPAVSARSTARKSSISALPNGTPGKTYSRTAAAFNPVSAHHPASNWSLSSKSIRTSSIFSTPPPPNPAAATPPPPTAPASSWASKPPTVFRFSSSIPKGAPSPPFMPAGEARFSASSQKPSARCKCNSKPGPPSSSPPSALPLVAVATKSARKLPPSFNPNSPKPPSGSTNFAPATSPIPSSGST